MYQFMDKLPIPKFNENRNVLILGNDALHQLNIFDNILILRLRRYKPTKIR